jgi:5-methyltetrahydropteroyltriglutamate--homocysteine methyltransferase
MRSLQDARQDRSAPNSIVTGVHVRDPARADVVGSLLRPAELRRAAERFHRRDLRSVTADLRSRDRSELTRREDEAVLDAIRRQIDAGLDVITDGELRRYMFQNSFWDAVDGFSTDRNPVEFRDDEGTTVTWHVQRIERRLERNRSGPAAQEAAFLARHTAHPFKVTFPAASLFALPFTFKPGINDHAYADLRELVDHCVDIERELVAETVAAGARAIQFDFPAYPYLVDPTWRAAIEATGWAVDQVLELAVEVDTAVVSAVPSGVPVSLHVCRGNNQSRYLCEGPLDAVADAMFSLPYDRFLVEWEDRRRMGGFEALAAVPRGGPIVVLGIVSSKRAELESAESLCRQIDDAARFCDLDQLAISTQCGFASTLPGNAISADEQWAKLALVGTVASMVWGE